MAKKKSNRRYSYAFLTMGGRRWVELTPERFARLYEKEQENIIRTAKYTNEDLRIMKKRDWEELNKDIGEMGGKIYQRLSDIARGRVAAEVEDINITNYATGIKMYGYNYLATVFESIARALKSKDKDAFDVFMREVPDLYLFYKDKGQSHMKRQKAFVQMTADQQIEEMEYVVGKYINEFKEDAKHGHSRIYNEFTRQVIKLDPKNADTILGSLENNEETDDDLPF